MVQPGCAAIRAPGQALDADQRDRIEAPVMMAIGHRTMERDLLPAHDQPQPAVRLRIGGIARRRCRIAAGVRMVAADNRRSACPLAAVGGDEAGGIDLEPRGWVGSDILAVDHIDDPPGGAEQQPAGLVRR